MRTALSIGIVVLLAACAGGAPRPTGEATLAGRWQGYMLRNGARESVSVELAESSTAWEGRLSTSDHSVPLSSVRVSGSNVHFESPVDGVFEGEGDGDSLQGSVSGPENGSFSLKRGQQWSPYPFGP